MNTTEQFPLLTHGTVYAYRQGCRCEYCRAEIAAKSRRLSYKRGGVCVDCGKPTTRKAGREPHERCRRCQRVWNGKRLHLEETTTQKAIVELLRTGPKTTFEIRQHAKLGSGGKVFQRLIKLGVIERVERGVYKLGSQSMQ